MTVASLVLPVEESFDVAEFTKATGNQLFPWRGSTDGSGTNGEVESDIRLLTPFQLNWDKVLLESYLQPGELKLEGEVRLSRARTSGNTLLGGDVFYAVHRNYQQFGDESILERLYQAQELTSLIYPGLVLRGRISTRKLLVHFRKHGKWGWNSLPLRTSWSGKFPMCCLPIK